jgi:hypothetical protein
VSHYETRLCNDESAGLAIATLSLHATFAKLRTHPTATCFYSYIAECIPVERVHVANNAGATLEPRRRLKYRPTVLFPKEGQRDLPGKPRGQINLQYSGQPISILGPRGVSNKTRVTRDLAFLWECYGTETFSANSKRMETCMLHILEPAGEPRNCS